MWGDLLFREICTRSVNQIDIWSRKSRKVRLGPMFFLFHIPHVAHLASGPIDQQFDYIKLRVVKMFG